jgi:NAD(P)H-dependent FMN reductase
MTTKPRIALVIGSTRPTRFADKPAQWMLKQAHARDDMDVELVDLRDHPLPFFAEVASNLHVPSKDPEAILWQERIAGFDGFIFVVAEYNHSVTGALKNALDQAYKEWNRKPFTAIAYGGAGGARAGASARDRRRASDGFHALGGPHRRQRLHGGVPDGRQQADRGDREGSPSRCQGGTGRTRLVGKSDHGRQGRSRLMPFPPVHRASTDASSRKRSDTVGEVSFGCLFTGYGPGKPGLA